MATQGDNSRTALIDGLNGLLADHFALYVKTKNFHWHVTGPRFRDLHLLFDEQAAEVQGMIDAIAERVRKNDAMTLTSLGTLISEGTDAIGAADWLLLFPGGVLVTMLLALAFIGDGLRDAFDPKDR